LNKVIHFVIEGKPQSKLRAQSARHHGQTRHYTPKKTKDYMKLVAILSRKAMGNTPIFIGPVGIKINAYMTIPKSWSKKKKKQAINREIRPITKPDNDNIEKVVWDGVKGIVWKDDCQVVDNFCHKYYSDNPRVVVDIWEWKYEGNISKENG